MKTETLGEGTVVSDTRNNPQEPCIDSVVDRLSRAYAERVERMNEVRERLDRISEILMPYLEEPQMKGMDLDVLKRILVLADYSETTRSRL